MQRILTTPRAGLLLALLLAAVLVPIRSPVAAQSGAGDPIAPVFTNYYYAEQRGLRVLGETVTYLLTANGFYSQYFDKGRIEWHPDAENLAWRFSYGRLVAELLERGASGPVSGETVSLTYADLRSLAAPTFRQAPPRPVAGPQDAGAAGVFVPYDAQLRAAPGHYVARPFWDYMQRGELFPGGWLHDLGLPLTEALTAGVVKGGQQRTITMQAFERAVLTDDPLNPAAWRIERGNIGRDYVALLPFGGERAAILAPIAERFGGATDPAVSWNLQLVEGDNARVLLIPDPQSQNKIDPAWVFLQRQGDQWQIIGGPGTAFEESFYDAAGIPALLRLGSAYERSLYETVGRFNPGIGPLRLTASAGGFALVEVLNVESNSARTPTYVYARLTGTPDWTVFGPPAATFDEAFYQQNRIPAALRLDAVR